MAQTTYTYEIASSFPNTTVNTTELKADIEHSSILTSLDWINTDTTDCFIIFSDALDAGEATTLDDIVSVHAGTASIDTYELALSALSGSYGTPSSANRFVTEQDPAVKEFQNVINVRTVSSSYTSVKSAVESITGATAASPWLVRISPGTYTESPFAVPSYVHVMGTGFAREVVVRTNTNDANFITLNSASTISGMSLYGPTGSGYACIDCVASSSPVFANRLTIYQGYYGINLHPEATALHHVLFGANLIFLSSINSAFKNCIRATDHASAMISLCAFEGITNTEENTSLFASGSNVEMCMEHMHAHMTGSQNAVYADAGATVRIIGGEIDDTTNGLRVGTTSPGAKIKAHSLSFESECVFEVKTDSSIGIITFHGQANKNKMSIASGSVFSAFFVDETNAENVNIGELRVGDVTTLAAGGGIPIRALTRDVSSTGKATGGALSRADALTVNVSSGTGYFVCESTVCQKTWSSSSVVLQDNTAEMWVVVDNNGVVTSSLARPDPKTNIVLGTATTSTGSIVLLAPHGQALSQYVPNHYEYFRDVVGPIVVNGGTVSKPSTPSLQFDVNSTDYYIFDLAKSLTATTTASFAYWHRGSGSVGWNVSTGSTEINPNIYDAGSGSLVEVPSGSWIRPVLYGIDNGTTTEFHVVHAQETFAASGSATTLPTPPEALRTKGIRLASFTVQSGANDIALINDDRPFLGQLGSSVSTAGVTAHGALTGLSNDDHPQYQLRSEKGQASGYCGLNASTKVDSTNLQFASTVSPAVSAAAAVVGSSGLIADRDHTHVVSTAAPLIGVGAANSAGAANTLARSDHDHTLRTTTGPTDLTIGAIADGEFLQRSGTTIIGNSSAGTITTYEYLNTATVTHNTNTPTLMTGCTFTPVAGTYMVWFSPVIGNNTSLIQLHIYANNALVTDSTKSHQQQNTGNRFTATCQAIVTVDGTQTIEGRWQVTTGTVTSYQRSFHLLRVA
jgi:hypothetical protein